MKNMNQGDLFNLIVELNFAKQIDIARAICSSTDLHFNVPDIQSCVNRAYKGGNGKPLINIIGSISSSEFATKIFQIIFKNCDIDNGATKEIAYDNFERIKNYLAEHNLAFNGMNSIANDSIPSFIIRMIIESFAKHKPHNETSNNQKKPITYTHNLISDSLPVLHSQNIFCPSKFFGRQNYLDNMRELICSYKLVVLYGIGGIGKTYLSRQYAHEYESNYKYKQIITYDKSSKSFRNAILSLKFDNLEDNDMSESDRLEKRISLLNNMSEDTLLIIDNIDTQPSDIDIFNNLRTNSNMHIIITTRLKDYFPSEQTLTVDPLPDEYQLNLFKLHYQEEITPDDLLIIKKILKDIDGHTLLIELVAKSMCAGALSPLEMHSYLNNKNSETELLPISINKDNLSSKKTKMDDYVKLLFDVGYLDESAKKALLFLSLLPFDGISKRLYYNLLPKYKASFNELISTSWAINDNNTIRLHPVIRDMIRKELKPSHINCDSVLANIHTHLQTQKNKLSEREQQDICKILHSISDIENFYNGCDNITMLSFFAEFSFKSYDFPLALELYSITAEIAEDGPIQTRTDLYIKLGGVYKRLAMLKDSINSFKKALESNDRLQPGPEKNLQEADIYLKLSDIYRKDGQYKQAMKCNNIAMEICENKQNGAKLSLLAEIYNRRGIIFLNTAESHENQNNRTSLLEEALVHYTKALNLRIECNDNNQQLAYSYHNIGTTYNKLGNYKLARVNHEKALALREADPNIPKPDIASSYVWIGNDYMAEDDSFMYLAKDNFEKSLEIRETILGKTHPEVAWSLMSLSEWYEKSGDIAKALNLAQRAYEIRINKYAPNHNYVLKSEEQINNLKHKLYS